MDAQVNMVQMQGFKFQQNSHKVFKHMEPSTSQQSQISLIQHGQHSKLVEAQRNGEITIHGE